MDDARRDLSLFVDLYGSGGSVDAYLAVTSAGGGDDQLLSPLWAQRSELPREALRAWFAVAQRIDEEERTRPPVGDKSPSWQPDDRLAALYVLTGDVDGAWDYLAQGDRRARFQLPSELLAVLPPTGEREYLERVVAPLRRLRSAPTRAAAWTVLGRVWSRLEEPGEAALCWERALGELAPSDPQDLSRQLTVAVELARTAREEKSEDIASRAIDAALILGRSPAVDPSSDLALWLDLAQELTLARRWSDARSCLEPLASREQRLELATRILEVSHGLLPEDDPKWSRARRLTF